MIKNDEDEGRNHQIADRIRNIENLIIDDTKRYLNSWILSIDTDVVPFQNIKKKLNDAKIVSFNDLAKRSCVAHPFKSSKPN